jgi:hypothetical protein
MNPVVTYEIYCDTSTLKWRSVGTLVERVS